MRFAQDLRYALRALRRTPTFTVTAVLILALGIGMTTAMFTVFRAVVLEQLPVSDPDRIVELWTFRDPTVELALSVTQVEDIRRESETLQSVAGINHGPPGSIPLTVNGEPVVLNIAAVTADFFEVLGARPELGRLLRAEDRDATSRVAVISHEAWREQFGSDPDVIGRRLTVTQSQRDITIVGVAPPGLDYPAGADYWFPMGPGPLPGVGFDVIARLAPGATAATARAEFLSIVQRLDRRDFVDVMPTGAVVRTLSDAVLGEAKPILVAITAAAALLLLIACVNVGNLLLLRAASRRREILIRRSLGASYGRIARLLMLESAVLGLAGGALGLAFANGLLRLLLAIAPDQLPRGDLIGLAGTPVGVAGGVTLVAVLLFGVLPALASARGDVAAGLRGDTRAGTGTTRGRRVRQSLVVVQVAMAVIMLAGAGLLVRSLRSLESTDLGYDPDRLSIVELSISPVESRAELNAMYDGLYRRLGEVPGVTALTPIVLPPFMGANVWQVRLVLEGQSGAAAEANPAVPVETGGSEYFRTFGIPILSGRSFRESDGETAPKVAVVSQALAQRLWSGEDPIGQRLRIAGGDSTTWRTVVGVAGDIRLRRLRESDPTLFLPWRQLSTQGYFAVRTQGDLASVLPSLRRAVREFSAKLDVWEAGTMEEYLAGPLSRPRLSALLLSGFGLVALLMAAIGLYGVMASWVRERTRDLGIRMALGATRERLRREVLGAALSVTMAGLVAGLVLALAGSRLLVALLFEVSPADPATFVGVSVLLFAVALLAAYLPARRATGIDPAQALRAD
ncbi:MAG: ABC transporter permease [Gemmatimonadota bacterium]